MSFFEAIVLSIVQGITEFLPISSSGHLVVIPKILSLPDQGLLFDVVVHAGSLLAILVYFRKDIQKIISAVFQKQPSYEKRIALGVTLGTIPAAVAGLLFQSSIETTFRDVLMVGIAMLSVGIVFVIFGNKNEQKKEFTLKEMLIVSVIQVIALIPGVSRSGMTTLAGVRLGHSHVDSAKYSFFLAIPVIFLATVKVSYDAIVESGIGAFSWYHLVGFVVTFVVSFAVIHLLLQIFRRFTLRLFGVYLVLFSALLLAFYR